MDRTELFLAVIVFLLAALLYETGDSSTPEILVIPVMMILFIFPVYVVWAIISENLIDR
ncbi:MAG: hypothetical protein ACLFNC_01410 [Halodesulfurarchaeum sp.]